MYLFQPNTNHAEGTRPYLHKSMKQFITLICAGLLMSSCATIFCGSKTKVTFDGEISEKATLTIDTNYNGLAENTAKLSVPGGTATTAIIQRTSRRMMERRRRSKWKSCGS